MGPVKDFVRDVWKIAAACATGAFLLSLAIGLIAGNPFGIAFARGLLCAVLFAGLGVGLRFVVRTYLPELAAAGALAGKTAEAAADHRGAAVDIVLPEDEGLRRQAYSGTSHPSRASTGEPGEGEPVEELGTEQDEDAASQAEAQALGELAEELPGGTESGAPGQRGGVSGGSEDEEAVEEVESEDGLPRSARESTEDLDSLPDIAALESSSPDRPGPSMRAPRAPIPGERPADAVKDVLGGQDPSTLARAIRTVLNKEEKG